MKHHKILSIAALLLLASVLTLSTGKAAKEGYSVGDTVEDFSLKNVDGSMVSLAGIPASEGYIVIFTCNHCPFSQAYEQRIRELDSVYKPLGWPVVAINPNDAQRVPEDSFEAMVERAKNMKYSFPYLHDESQSVARRFGATRTPHVFLVKKDGGKNTVAYIGAIDDNTEDASHAKSKYIELAITAIKNNQTVATTETKAVGCTIKWKK